MVEVKENGFFDDNNSEQPQNLTTFTGRLPLPPPMLCRTEQFVMTFARLIIIHDFNCKRFEWALGDPFWIMRRYRIHAETMYAAVLANLQYEGNCLNKSTNYFTSQTNLLQLLATRFEI